jgi:transposase
MALGNHLPEYVQDQIKTLYYESDLSIQAIADEVKVGRNCVWRRVKCLELFGELYPPQTVGYGRPAVLDYYQKEVSLSSLYSSKTDCVP